MAAGYAAGNLATATDRTVTINERLNKISEALQYQCERIESVLARVNGTPQKIENAIKGANVPTPTLPMSAIVEHLEAVQSRLSEISGQVERIA